jgi:serine/threonine-protein kinase
MLNTEKLCMGCMSEIEEGSVCSACGFDETAYNEPLALPLKSLLADRYLVGKVLSQNGEGFTYLGYDKAENKVVRIREYFPAGIASRVAESLVEVENNNSFVFNDGLLKFIDLHKKLATLNENTALYRVLDIFETSNTAYCINEYLPGITLKEFLIRNGGMLKWEQVRPLFLPLITAIKELHSKNVVHGGISPETLIVGRDGKIRITDFTIPEIRTVNDSFTAQLFPGFAALEQYKAEEITTATDIYSFAATIFRTLTGNPPAEATARLERDTLTFSKAVAEQLPKGVLVALANALKLNAENRTSSMDSFKNDISSSEIKLSEETAALKKEIASKKPSSAKNYTILAAAITGTVLLILGLIVFLILNGKGEPDNESSSSTISMPSVVSVGDIGNSEKPEALFSVPDFTNMTYSEIMSNDEYNKWFVFEVAKKEYSSTIAKGKVCSQSVAVGTSVKRDTEIGLTISLGPKEVVLPNKLNGMAKEEAYITLLELGFEPSNIEFIAKMGGEQTEEEVIIDALPSIGSKVNPNSYIILYYNSNIKTNELENTDQTQSSVE